MISGWVKKVTEHRGTIQYFFINVKLTRKQYGMQRKKTFVREEKKTERLFEADYFSNLCWFILNVKYYALPSFWWLIMLESVGFKRGPTRPEPSQSQNPRFLQNKKGKGRLQ